MEKRTNQNPVVTGIQRLLIVFLAFALLSSLTACSKNDSNPTPTPGNLPAVVTGLTVTPQDGKDSLVWNANLSTDNVTTYNVYAGSSASTLVLVGSTNKAIYIHTGLTNGSVYYYSIAAVNSKGEGPKSSSQSATPNPQYNSLYAMSISQTLPAILHAAPARYYDPTNAYYYPNPTVLTDSMKYVIDAQIFDGFDSTTIYETYVNGGNIAQTYKLISDFRLPLLSFWDKLGYTRTQISYWEIGGNVTNNVQQYGYDTIPCAFYVKNTGGKQLSDVIKNIRFRVESAYRLELYIKGLHTSYVPFIDKTYNVSDFTYYNTLQIWDKHQPSIFKTTDGWLFIIPITNNQNSSASPEGYNSAQYQVNYTDGSSAGRTMIRRPFNY